MISKNYLTIFYYYRYSKPRPIQFMILESKFDSGPEWFRASIAVEV